LFRTFCNITAAAATVTAVFVRVFSSYVYVFFILILGRRIQQLDAFPLPPLFNQLKRAKEEI
jgi:hypothetical protein